MQICAIERQTDIPDDLPNTASQKDDYLMEVATKLVETVWNEVPRKDVSAVLDSADDPEILQYYEYCFCKEGVYMYIVVCYALTNILWRLIG